MRFFRAFNILPRGVYRLIIAFGIIIPIIVGTIVQLETNSADGVLWWVGFFYALFGYWILARIGLWIYAGFLKDKHEKETNW